MRANETLQRLLRELHDRSLWQVFLAYLGASVAVLEGIDLLSGRYGFPDGLFTLALILLSTGLLIGTVATAWSLWRFLGGLEEPSTVAGETGTLAYVPGSERRRSSWRRMGLILLTALAAWGVVATGWLVAGQGRIEAASARAATVERVTRLVDDRVWDSAFAAMAAVEDAIPGDSVLEALWATVSRQARIESTPTGVEVYRRPWDGSEADWTLLGSTPLESAVPRGAWRLRFQAAGYRPLELTASARWIDGNTVHLSAVGDDSDDEVHVPGGEFTLSSPGLEHVQPVDLGPYRIDRHEVTNAQFKRFVDADGYGDPTFWVHPFVQDGDELSWSQAMERFVDRTARPGPSTWEASDFPTGLDDYPVAGISWYEAAAYARFAGKELPSVYHWNRAAGTPLSSVIVPFSNLEGRELAPVGQFLGAGPYGALDMAGNVREWCYNESAGERFILGGGWNDAQYMFMDGYTQSPWDRSPTNGVRLARYESPEDVVAAGASIVRPYRDFMREEPVSDEVYQVYLGMYAYDDTPLNAAVEGADSSSADWIKERITFDAAYEDERVVAYLYVPRSHPPPYQTVVLFPGSNAIHSDTSDRIDPTYLSFLMEGGRALLYPIYKGTWERGDDLDTDMPDESVSYRDHVIQWARDLGRSIDYLETRDDIDTDALAYFGTSWGGRMGGLMVAVEPRFEAAVLFVAGLKFQRALPEADPFNFVPRIRVPVLMLNGRYDHFFPLETSQKPMFELLGTDPAHKRHVVSEGGHSVPQPQLIRETLDWLDRYLGPPP